MLLFGLRSAPFIFDSIAEVVEWILTTNYSITDLLHYLDDFLTAGPWIPGSPSDTYKGTSLAGDHILFRVDNEAVVPILNSHTSQDVIFVSTII